MYLYNISIIIEESQHQVVLDWLKSTWLPQLANETKFLKMINSPHEGHTYCIQLMNSSESEISKFQENELVLLQEYLAINHHEKAFIFDSIMQYL